MRPSGKIAHQRRGIIRFPQLCDHWITNHYNVILSEAKNLWLFPDRIVLLNTPRSFASLNMTALAAKCRGRPETKSFMPQRDAVG